MEKEHASASRPTSAGLDCGFRDGFEIRFRTWRDRMQEKGEGCPLRHRAGLANELGVSPYVMRIYEDIILPQLSDMGTARKQVYQTHYSRFGRRANQQWYEKEIFPTLSTAGLIIEEPDPKRQAEDARLPP